MSEEKASAEELENAQAHEEAEDFSEEESAEEIEDKESKEGEESDEDEEPEEEEEEIPTIPLDKYTSTKDTLNRLADMYVGDEDSLAELAEEDPKLLARLKKEFPKKFKDVKVPNKQISEDDIDARLDERLEKRDRASQVESLRKDLGLTTIEFSDIKEDVIEQADKYFDAEVTEDYNESLVLALKKIKPSMANDLNAQRQTKRKTSKMSGGKSANKSEKTDFEKLEDSFSADMPKGFSAK